MFSIKNREILKICVLLLVLLYTNMPVYADELQDKSMQNIQTATGTVPESNTKNEEHIIPVLELKGRVREEKAPAEESAFKSWLNGDYATGNWMSLRTKLEKKA